MIETIDEVVLAEIERVESLARERELRSKYKRTQYVRVTHNTSELLFYLLRHYKRTIAMAIAERLSGKVVHIVGIDEFEEKRTPGIFYTIEDKLGDYYVIPERLLLDVKLTSGGIV